MRFTFATALISIQLVPLFGQLPDGEYRYRSNNSDVVGQILLLRKVRNRVVGAEVSSGRDSSNRSCFEGAIQRNSIVQATYIAPPYTPDAHQHYQPGLAIDLSYYQLQPEVLSQSERFTLLTCVEVFSR